MTAHLSRLERLKELRRQIDDEIKLEERRIELCIVPVPRRPEPVTKPDLAEEEYLEELARSASSTVVRAWAREQGLEVGDTGRVRMELCLAYARAVREGVA